MCQNCDSVFSKCKLERLHKEIFAYGASAIHQLSNETLNKAKRFNKVNFTYRVNEATNCFRSPAF
ncbi:CLUMA_CG003162, isoform A [Clunio marinus]|uniref:CLUMA_CG003162, isoform A n=1 Tax=Clunio marinus TaxID=568069 RepID=A0A1J1HMY5_9DIPT|nr:CLUMA_CG003162, isoform A [Clunio marinus]